MFDIRKLPDDTCPDCGRVYSVESEKGPLNERGKFDCKCGRTLKSWKGTTEYYYTLKSEEGLDSDSK